MSENEGAWLFGDIGRPLLGSSSSEFLSKSIPGFSEWTRPLFKNPVGGPARGKASLRLERQNEQLIALYEVLKRCIEIDGVTLENKAFVISQTDNYENVQLCNLPWTRETWEVFRKSGFDENESIDVLEGMTWREIFNASNPYEVFFDIVQMISDWLPYASKNDLLVDPSASIDDIVRAFQLETMARANFNISSQIVYQDLLQRRNGWGVPAETLDDLGSSWGLTRERVRQIEALLGLIVKSRTRDSWSLLREISLFTTHDKFLDVAEGLRETFSLNENWNLDTVSSLLESLCDRSVAMEFEKQVLPNDLESIAQMHRVKAVRDARSIIGVIKLDAVADPEGPGFLPVQEAIWVAQSAYAKVNHAGNYAIVSRLDSSAGIYTAIAHQLSVSSSLHLDQVLVGVMRAATQRNAQNTLPDRQTFIQLLRQSEDFDLADNFMVTGRAQEHEQGTIQRWLLDLVSAQEGAIMSKAEVFREALLSDVKLSSLNLYLTFQPTLRPAGRGLVTIVGNTPTRSAIEFANSIAEARYVANGPLGIESLNLQEFQLKFIFSTPFFESGTISSSELLRQMFGTNAKRIYCCPEFDAETNSSVKIKNNFLYGLAGAKDHLLYRHGYSEGDQVTLVISEDSVRMKL